MRDIKGDVVMITGASSGFGELTARQLAAKGAKLVLGARRLDKLEALRQELGGDVAVVAATDVTKPKDLQALAEAGIKQFGQIDALVNNAGIMPLSPLAAGQVKDWDAMIDTNIKGVLYGIHAVLNHMLERGGGRIVNVSSVAGLRVMPTATVYSGTKFAVRAISDGLRQETNGKLQITCVYPGAFMTELGNTVTHKATREVLLARFQPHQIEDPKHIAEAIVYALSQDPQVAVNELVMRPIDATG